jgi:hypothetical protein
VRGWRGGGLISATFLARPVTRSSLGQNSFWPHSRVLVECLFLLLPSFLCVAWSCTVVDKNDHTIGAIHTVCLKDIQTLQSWNFLIFSFFLWQRPAWIRIRVPNLQDPLTHLNPDPIRIRNNGFADLFYSLCLDFSLSLFPELLERDSSTGGRPHSTPILFASCPLIPFPKK